MLRILILNINKYTLVRWVNKYIINLLLDQSMRSQLLFQSPGTNTNKVGMRTPPVDAHVRPWAP